MSWEEVPAVRWVSIAAISVVAWVFINVPLYFLELVA